MYHNGKWHRLGPSITRNCPTLGPQFSEVGIYNIYDNLPSYQPRTDTPILDLGDLTLALPDPEGELAPQVQFADEQAIQEETREGNRRSDSKSESSKESIDQEIRNSPVVIPKPLHPTSAQVKPVTMAMETMYTTHTMEQPDDGGPSTIGTVISMSMAQQIHQSLQQSM